MNHYVFLIMCFLVGGLNAQIAIVRTIPSDSLFIIENKDFESSKVGDTITIYDKQSNGWEMISQDITTGIIEKIALPYDWVEAEVVTLDSQKFYVNDYAIGLYDIGDTIRICKKKTVQDQKELDWRVYTGSMPPGNFNGMIIKYAIVRKKWR